MGNRRSGARVLRWLVLPALVVGMLVPAPPHARADDPSAELVKQKDKLAYIQQQKAAAENAFQRVAWETEEANVQLEQADVELAEAQGQLDIVTNQVVIANAQLKQVEADLQETQKRYELRKEVLGDRIRTINEEGRVNYLAVLLGSHSFSDFISRFEMLKVIVQKDSQLFTQVRADKAQLEEQKALAEVRKTELVRLQAQEQERVAVMETQRAEREVVSRSLETRKRELLNQLDAFDQAEQEAQQAIWAIQQRMNRAPGDFSPMYPVKNYTITDVFGPRMHPILGVPRMHNGTDFAANAGTPVRAIDDGVVIVAGWNDAFGNLVVIDHGGGIASWYGHSRKLLVSEGETVTQGQQISEAGSTGWSTGPHVHLEIHVNGQPVDPMSYLP